MPRTHILLSLTIVSCRYAPTISRHPAISAEADAPFTISISPALYPTARRDESIVDDFYGTKVADPYRWMEDPDAPETRRFVSELNAISEPFLAKAPNREDIRKEWALNFTDL
ncbi:hypothetical protein ANCCEY_04035 [Ancylostoma ceylanicum]|uniref:Peptidase S9A N-terminal domain-containing protein n=2 Tax=Ancylostoma ceylanicum TaxID=53326 RepID=A0A0D6LYL3_9BILA|nr:hypothetical protein ANCCEY_04035 [Ancylostoma ceylanicum]EYB82852.1 hypothetical protein Y032_0349g3200 [Ancylostoma ceylanicum]